MGNRQTNYTRVYREKIRRDALVFRELREISFDHPDLKGYIEEAEHRVDRRLAAKAAGEL